ncbi:MAG TPA: hypothetical protein VMU29_09990 [Smithella sp.]|nr:hypothetical protein [Smithella sp.]
MSVLKLLLAFAPWISFLIIAHGSMFHLKLGLIVALILSVIMGITRLHRGIILWVGLTFFTISVVAIVLFENMWIARHMGVIANGTLAFFTWLTILLKKPFTLEYAKEHTDRSIWNSPVFIRTNIIITSIWGLGFTANTVLAFGKMEHYVFSELTYEIISYTLLIGAVIFTNWYPDFVRNKRQQA